jgi:hypothetical protein
MKLQSEGAGCRLHSREIDTARVPVRPGNAVTMPRARYRGPPMTLANMRAKWNRQKKSRPLTAPVDFFGTARPPTCFVPVLGQLVLNSFHEMFCEVTDGHRPLCPQDASCAISRPRSFGGT